LLALHSGAQTPARRRVLFKRFRVPQPYGEIFAMRSDGSDVRQLTDNKWEDASPGWMPEPKKSSGARQ